MSTQPVEIVLTIENIPAEQQEQQQVAELQQQPQQQVNHDVVTTAAATVLTVVSAASVSNAQETPQPQTQAQPQAQPQGEPHPTVNGDVLQENVVEEPTRRKLAELVEQSVLISPTLQAPKRRMNYTLERSVLGRATESGAERLKLLTRVPSLLLLKTPPWMRGLDGDKRPCFSKNWDHPRTSFNCNNPTGFKHMP